MAREKIFSQTILRTFLCGVALCFVLATHAQVSNKVAVGTRNPTETLDVNGTLRVTVLPEEGQELIFTVNGGTNNGKAAANFDQPYTCNRVVMADVNGVLGIAPTPPGGFFYMPPVLLPLSEYAVTNLFNDPSIYTYTAAPATQLDINGVYTVDLHKLYNKQFSTPQAKSSPSSSLPVHVSSALDFFVVYYDTSVFADVQLSNSGVLSYKVRKKLFGSLWIDIMPTEDTFMNIIFCLK